MILHRFCSAPEAEMFLSGKTLVNRADHYQGGRGGSLSRGFCFFEGDVAEWARRLNGLVEFDVLLTVEVDPVLVNKSSGVYADWAAIYTRPYPPQKLFTEYCTEIYNRQSFRLVSQDRTFGESYVSASAIGKILNSGKAGLR